jgi:hypothetical protein
VCSCAAGMDHAFGNSFVVEMGDLFAKVEVFEQCRSAITRFERMVGVGESHPLGRGQKRARLAAVVGCAGGAVRGRGVLIGTRIRGHGMPTFVVQQKRALLRHWLNRALMVTRSATVYSSAHDVKFCSSEPKNA